MAMRFRLASFEFMMYVRCSSLRKPISLWLRGVTPGNVESTQTEARTIPQQSLVKNGKRLFVDVAVDDVDIR